MPCGRRTALTCGLLALAGCTSLTDPVIHAQHAKPVSAGLDRDVAAALRALLAHRDAVEHSATPAPWRQGMLQMLDAHNQALTGPLESPATTITFTLPPSASATPSAHPPTGTAALTATADALAARHEHLLLAADDTSMALLWASLVAATRLTRQPGPVPVTGVHPRRVALGDEVDSRNVRLGHLHSLSQAIDVQRGAANRADEALLAARQQDVRQRITAEQHAIRALKGEPVAPLPGYRWPGDVTRRDTLTLIERQIAQASGAVVATSPRGRRKAALDEFVTLAAKAWDAPPAPSVPFFPGWG